MNEAAPHRGANGSTLFVVNPAGHGGTGTSTWESFRSLWPDPVDLSDVVITQRPGEAREIAASAEGYDTIAAVGGDGTVGDIVSGILDREGSKPKLAIVPAGTGNDIARNTGTYSVEDAVRSLRDGRLREFDMIRVDFQADYGPAHRYAFLVVAVGFSAIPMIRPWMKRLLGPAGAYYLATFLQITVYRPPVFTVRADGRERSRGRSWMVMVGNVEYSAGGSMRVAPGARTDDGELNVTVFPVRSRYRMITRLLPRVASGEHIEEPGVLYFPAKTIEIESDPPAILDLDGDVFGATPAVFTVCPGALEVLTPG